MLPPAADMSRQRTVRFVDLGGKAVVPDTTQVGTEIVKRIDLPASAIFTSGRRTLIRPSIGNDCFRIRSLAVDRDDRYAPRPPVAKDASLGSTRLKRRNSKALPMAITSGRTSHIAKPTNEFEIWTPSASTPNRMMP